MKTPSVRIADTESDSEDQIAEERTREADEEGETPQDFGPLR
jgi:hypothetical protein